MVPVVGLLATEAEAKIRWVTMCVAYEIPQSYPILLSKVFYKVLF